MKSNTSKRSSLERNKLRRNKFTRGMGGAMLMQHRYFQECPTILRKNKYICGIYVCAIYVRLEALFLVSVKDPRFTSNKQIDK